MKITKAKLKQIIKEELSKENHIPSTVEDFRKLLDEADPEAEVVIKHRYGIDPLEIYDAYPAEDGGVVITIREATE